MNMHHKAALPQGKFSPAGLKNCTFSVKNTFLLSSSR